MVTCNIDSISKKMNRNSSKRTTTTTIIEKKTLESISGSISSSGYRLLIDSTGNVSGYSSGVNMDACETMSNVSRNSIYKQRIDSMFDDSRSIISQKSTRRRAPSINGSITGSNRYSSDRLQSISENEFTNPSPMHTITNSVQAQIEKMFIDIAQSDSGDISSSFSIKCLGALPLRDRVTSLSGLQEPLRQLYLSGAGHGHQNAGNLDICKTGIKIRFSNGRESALTPFQNIAVWSAVKFVVSQEEGGAAFLPLITDPDNIDKSALFKPLSAADKRRLSSAIHSPLFAVVMKSPSSPKKLECHGYICQSPEDAIIIAATLYQSLMAYMSVSQSTKIKKPKNKNGISCMSIASSSALTSHQLSSRASLRRSGSGSTRGSARGSTRGNLKGLPLPPPSRPLRKKRSASNSISGDSDAIKNLGSIHSSNPDFDSSTDERNKKKAARPKKPPPIPSNPPNLARRSELYNINEQQRRLNSDKNQKKDSSFGGADGISGDILTKVAIPRSGSFLNTAGLTRYKSRATRRNEIVKPGNGNNFTSGGGGSPLGFSELFNEFRLQENLHSLDEILNAIIDSDGMSFNDLKPIYKEFLLKLAVTLTKDELYQRSKSIMRRQKKKKMKRNNPSTRTRLIVGALGLKRILLGKFKNKKSGSLGGSHTRTKQRLRKKSEFEQKTRTRRLDRSRIGTSESEISVHRNENGINLHNRNSSSGYVSCSECSYDSDNCTCNSADRCYCSLGGDDIHAKLKAEENVHSDSLQSCNSEDKCYCSMGDGDGSTTWCDTDSCVSASKCYCSPERKTSNHKNGIKTSNKGKSRKTSENFALDYELFTVGANTRHVRPTEALSVKKSVEMAALFADVKLSQTTDITNLKSSKDKNFKQKHHHKAEHESSLNDSSDNKVILRNKKNLSSDDFTTKTGNRDLILRKDLDVNAKKLAKSESFYQAIAPRPVSASLEDSLGYLP